VKLTTTFQSNDVSQSLFYKSCNKIHWLNENFISPGIMSRVFYRQAERGESNRFAFSLKRVKKDGFHCKTEKQREFNLAAYVTSFWYSILSQICDIIICWIKYCKMSGKSVNILWEICQINLKIKERGFNKILFVVFLMLLRISLYSNWTTIGLTIRCLVY
jgi:hypothetical protein